MPRARYPMHVVVHVPPPRLHRLRRVVPIGQAQEHHGVEGLALALEVYAAGFVATCQIQSLGAGPDLGDADDAERSPGWRSPPPTTAAATTRVRPTRGAPSANGGTGSGAGPTASRPRSTPPPALSG